MRKRILLLLVITVFFIFSLLIFNVVNINKKNVEIKYYTSVEANNSSETPWWEIIRSKEALLNCYKHFNINLEELKNINFDENAIIISYGHKINKIVYREKYYLTIFGFDYSGVAHLEDVFYSNTAFVYLINANEKVFVDQHYNPEVQYIIDGTNT